MKKSIVYLFMLFLVACGNEDSMPTVDAPPPAPLSKSKNSEVFNESFTQIINAYIHLKDNFITESLPMIDFYAQEVIKKTDSLNYSELKGDAGITENAKSFAGNLNAELKGLLGEKDLTKKRKAFNMVSEQLYNLIRIVQYDKQIIYHQHTANAFADGDTNAFWLSTSRDIKNPYNPNKLTDGEIADSLDYSR